MFQTVQQEIAGVDVLELAARFGSPTYIYDAGKIREQIAQLRRFDVIRYAQKANSNLAVLRLMREHGVAVDAVSAGEIYRAEQAGYNPDASHHEVVYTADIFDRDAMKLVLDRNMAVNVGSPDMIRQLGEVAPGREVTLRINPGFGHGHSQKTNTGGSQSKHGVWFEQIDDCLGLAHQYRIQISGLHMHIGSGSDFEHLARVCGAMREAVRRVGNSVRVISAGGGLPTPYKDSDQPIDTGRYFEIWDETRNDLQTELGHEITLETEPGRFLVAESGYLVTEIRAIKSMGENLFYLVDAGFNNLARPIMYGSYHPMAVAFRTAPANIEHQPVVVGGPLCESGDIFTQTEGGFVCSRELPVASVGDFLLIGCAGAYGFVMSSNYNSKPLAAEVLVDAGEARLIRRRQSFDDLIACELEIE